MVGIYITTFLFPVEVFPDFFHLAEISNIRQFIWGLFTATLGFSGLMLTLLLLNYNSFVKSIKRNTLEFVLDNVYIKILFSGFISILFLQITSYCIFHSTNFPKYTAALYYLILITVLYILSQIPLAILSIKYSTSIERIDRLINEIDHKDFHSVLNPNMEDYSFEDLERNRIIMLKEFGVNAIRDGDWVLPQKIMDGLLEFLPKSLTEDCPPADTDQVLDVLIWIFTHFKRAAIKSGDHIIVSVIKRNAFYIYNTLIDAKYHRTSELRKIDDFIKEFILSIILTKDFIEVRSDWVKNYAFVIEYSLSSFTYADTELPTDYYYYTFSRHDIATPLDAEHYQFWHYVMKSQVEILIDVLKFAIIQKDNRVYSAYHTQFQSIIFHVLKSENLTESQRRTFLNHLREKVPSLESTAIENGLVEETPIFSCQIMELFIDNGWIELYNYSLFDYNRLIRAQMKNHLPIQNVLFHMTTLGEVIIRKKNLEIMTRMTVMDTIIELMTSLFSEARKSKEHLVYLKHSIQSLFKQIKKEELYTEIVDRFGANVESIIKFSIVDEHLI
ncbi:hypothetical protein D3C87_130280 [compost metagenome]